MENKPHSRGAVAAYLGRITVTDRGGYEHGQWPVTITYDGCISIRTVIDRQGNKCRLLMPSARWEQTDRWAYGDVVRYFDETTMPCNAWSFVSITDPDLRTALTIAAYDYVIQYEADNQAQAQADRQWRIDQMMAERDQAAA